MRRLSVIALILLAMSPVSQMHGQALPTAVGPGKSIKVGGGYALYRVDYGKRDIAGYQAWVDANFYWRIGVEAEARRLRHHTDLNTYADTYLIGPRWVLLRRNLSPYVKGMVGVGKFNFPYNYGHGSYFVVAGGGGVDLPIAKRIQWRVVDVEYQKWPQFTFGSMTSMGVSTGISITLYHGATWRTD
ncbi:MAG: hypothetical protein JSS87_03540 [Acidobacteria bacterium]|nr:hypothetical protein [Acidobacteriota bacterium]